MARSYALAALALGVSACGPQPVPAAPGTETPPPAASSRGAFQTHCTRADGVPAEIRTNPDGSATVRLYSDTDGHYFRETYDRRSAEHIADVFCDDHRPPPLPGEPGFIWPREAYETPDIDI